MPRVKYNMSINCGENRPSLAEFLDLEKKASSGEDTTLFRSINIDEDDEKEETHDEEMIVEKSSPSKTATNDEEKEMSTTVDIIPETQMPSSSNGNVDSKLVI